MKNTLIKNILVLSALISMGACKKQLELYQPGTIATAQSFQTITDGTSWDNGFYSTLRNNVWGNYWLVTQEVAGDQLNAGLDYGNRNGFPHQWGTVFNSSDYNIQGVWQGYYAALKDINLCIQNFKNITIATSNDSAKLNKYLGDAYLARAYYYSELVIRFAKPYEPATAATDLGVPLVLTYDVNAQPARATVKETYDQILSDIAKAKTLLAGIGGSQGSNVFTIDVVNALEARVRLYMQDWTGAMAAANAVIATNKYPLINDAATFKRMWQKKEVSPEIVFQCAVPSTTEIGNNTNAFVNNVFMQWSSSTGKYNPDFIPTKSIIDFYDAADIRKSAYFASLSCQNSGGVFTLTLVTKYPGDSSLFTGTYSNYENAPKIFRVAEQYLIYAEAAAKSGTNDGPALAVLNSLRTARGLTALTGLTGAPLLQAIKDERTRELAFEGFHLWDLKRWHQGFTRGTPQNLGPIKQGATFNLLTISADDNKFTWGIPTNDILINKNLKQNPGW